MLKNILRFLKKVFLWLIALSVFLVILFKFVPVPFTPLMVSRAIENIGNGNGLEFSHDWESIDNISPNMQKAVIASEDAGFMEHYGFDFKAMKKAMESNRKGKRLKGGSTISQQTAKNVFLWQGRSYFRKALEAYFTVLIEIIWGKERIMEVYLNSIEMGKNVYGAEAAAYHYYLRNAATLTPQQAASIAAILPNPRKYKATNSGPYIQRRKTRILRHMRYVGKLEY
ncbi:MAG TPA: monofunctional biosynthetic peptidoglycan transglycosylase [Flavobacterium sp.]|jgi:monofunctional biosynthetic peptidoglycan transglycosylase